MKLCVVTAFVCVVVVGGIVLSSSPYVSLLLGKAVSVFRVILSSNAGLLRFSSTKTERSKCEGIFSPRISSLLSPLVSRAESKQGNGETREQIGCLFITLSLPPLSDSVQGCQNRRRKCSSPAPVDSTMIEKNMFFEHQCCVLLTAG